MPLNFSNLQLAYNFILQQVDGQNNILGTIPNAGSITLPNGVGGGMVYNVAAGSVDQSLAIAQGDFTDFVMLWSDTAITYKLDSTAGSPLRMRAGGMHILDSSTVLGVFVSNSTPANAQVYFFQSRRTAIPAA